MVSLYVFDFHGTLAKGNECAVVESTNLSLEEHGRKERLTLEDTYRWQGKPWADYFIGLCPGVSEKEIASMVSCAKRLGYKIFPKHTSPMEHVVEVLQEIKRRGDISIVISNTTPDALDKYLQHIGIINLVNDRIGITNEVEKTGRLDVAKDKGRKLAEYIKDKNFDGVTVIGDTEDDVRAGKMVNATTFYFNQDGKKIDLADYSISDLRKVLEV